jgi:peptidyl-prolyl cis-trans isomerase A (cyclophilin A)
MKATHPLAVVAIALAACGKPAPEPTAESSSASPSAPAPAPGPSGPLASVLHPDLLDPSKASQKAPDVYKAKFTTTKGDFIVEVHRDWSPSGADRFYNLVRMGFFDDVRFFRNVPGFMVQFGLSGDPAVNRKWLNANIPDDPVRQSNKKGFVTFAQTGAPNTRDTQVFVNFGDNSRLDDKFAPFGQVVQGMDVVDSFFNGYGESPNQGAIQMQGNAYLDVRFPKLDGVKHAEIVK